PAGKGGCEELNILGFIYQTVYRPFVTARAVSTWLTARRNKPIKDVDYVSFYNCMYLCDRISDPVYPASDRRRDPWTVQQTCQGYQFPADHPGCVPDHPQSNRRRNPDQRA